MRVKRRQIYLGLYENRKKIYHSVTLLYNGLKFGSGASVLCEYMPGKL